MLTGRSEPALDAPRFYAGRMLLALPGMGDPNFDHSAIAMCVHDENGARGVDVGRVIEGLSMAELVANFGVDAAHLTHVPVLRGGPVEPQRGFVLHSRDWGGQDSIEVTPEWALSGSLDILKAIGAGMGPDRFLMVLGYSGWGAGQLEHEMRMHGWFLGEHIPEDLPAIQPARRWDACFSACGVDSRLLCSGMGEA